MLIGLAVGLAGAPAPAPLGQSVAPPVVAGSLDPLVLEPGTGTVTVAAAAVFSGADLVFALAAPVPGVSIDAATGSVSVDTAATGAQDGLPVRILAVNGGGVAEAAFPLSVGAAGFVVSVGGLSNNPTHGPTAEIGAEIALTLPSVTAPVAYDWRLDGVPVPGATAAAFTVPASADLALLSCRVMPEGLVSQLVEIATVRHAPPVADTPPTISGAAAFGATLSLAPGVWTEASGAAPAFRWTRDGTDIPGATGTAYVVGLADSGAVLSAVETRSNSGGTAEAAAAGMQVSAFAAPVILSAPVVTGTPEVGALLTAARGAVSGDPAPEPSGEWHFGDDNPIAGATGDSLVVPAAAEGQSVYFRQIETNALGQASEDSLPTDVVLPPPLPAEISLLSIGEQGADGDLSVTYTIDKPSAVRLAISSRAAAHSAAELLTETAPGAVDYLADTWATGGQTSVAIADGLSGSFFLHVLPQNGTDADVAVAGPFDLDTVGPSISGAAIALTGQTDVDISFTADEALAWRMSLYDVAAAPSLADLSAGTGAAFTISGDAVAAGVQTASATGLAPGVSYRLHVFAQDAKGNAATLVSDVVDISTSVAGFEADLVGGLLYTSNSSVRRANESFAAADLGAPAPDRVIYLLVTAFTADTTTAVTGVSVAGMPATELAGEASAGWAKSVLKVALPDGASGDIDITLDAATGYEFAVQVVRGDKVSTEAATALGNGSATSLDIGLPTYAGGVLAAMAFASNTSGAGFGGTDAPAEIETHDLRSNEHVTTGRTAATPSRPLLDIAAICPTSPPGGMGGMALALS
ncbi:MAG: hypothetical protein QNJ13_10920 [Paracoccaceae bacterium]|nr:hypothetical protein [Paracoccaceae bacterium]